jgi:hypothetical protein
MSPKSKPARHCGCRAGNQIQLSSKPNASNTKQQSRAEWALTKNVRLSDRLALTMTIGPLGFVCEWEPDRPDLLGIKDLTETEWARYRAARSEMLCALADRQGFKGRILVIEL